jgi:hypothetical protein
MYIEDENYYGCGLRALAEFHFESVNCTTLRLRRVWALCVNASGPASGANH